MLAFKPKTVATVTASLTKVIDDLNTIAETNMVKASALAIQAETIQDQINVADLEVTQARAITGKLYELIGQVPPL